VFSGKSDYVAVMSGIFPGRAHAFDIVTGVDAPMGQLIARTNVLVPFCALVVVGWAAWRALRGSDRIVRLKVMALSAFGVVALGAGFPRLGPQHLTEAMPLLLVVPFAAWGLVEHSTRPDPHPGTRRLLLPPVLATALILCTALVVVWAGGPPPRDTASVRRDVATLRTDTGGRVFIVNSAASYYYLDGRLQNPTPFDYPSLSDFGARGESGVIAMLRHRSAAWVCVRRKPSGRPHAGGGDPTRLEQFVYQRFVFTARLSMCDLYRDPRAARAS
jgi:hypothetical protein